MTEGAVIDCFAGSGVTGTAARARGLAFSGIEAHPLVAELAELKLAPISTASQVRSLVEEVASLAGFTDSRLAVRIESESDLVQRSFDKETLLVLVRIRQLIKARLEDPAALYLKWALLATLRDVARVKVGWPYQRPGVARRPRHSNPLARFETRVRFMIDDLDTLDDSSLSPSAQVVLGDSRDPNAWAKLTTRASASVASPPYLNNFDYADATRLELYFWGEISTWREMCREVRSDMLTATTQQSSVREMKEAIASLEERSTGPRGPVEEILGVVESITEAKRQRERRSKEYDQVAPAYFMAMSEILDNLYHHLLPGGTALWLVGDSAPYGVYVDTPRLIGELAAQIGFDFVDDVSLRVRGNRWGQNTDRHQVPLAERLIVLKKQTGHASSSPPVTGSEGSDALSSLVERMSE